MVLHRIIDNLMQPVRPPSASGNQIQHQGLRQDEMPALPAQNRTCNLAPDVLGLQKIVLDGVERVLDPVLDERGLDPERVHGGGFDVWGVVAVFELLVES